MMELLIAVITDVITDVLYMISEKKTRKLQVYITTIKGRKIISVMLLQMECWSVRLTHFPLTPTNLEIPTRTRTRTPTPNVNNSHHNSYRLRYSFSDSHVRTSTDKSFSAFLELWTTRQ